MDERYFAGTVPAAGQVESPIRLRSISKNFIGCRFPTMRSPYSTHAPSLILAPDLSIEHGPHPLRLRHVKPLACWRYRPSVATPDSIHELKSLHFLFLQVDRRRLWTLLRRQCLCQQKRNADWENEMNALHFDALTVSCA